MLCNSNGRDSNTGNLRAEAINSTLAAVGGARQDLEKITFVIEPIFKRFKPVKNG